MNTNPIQTNSLEIFKQNVYLPTDIGLVSNNAYLSIVVTNKCQCKCPYCINSETDQRLQLPIDKAVDNIQKLVKTYGVKEAILLGGEPLLHPELFRLLRELRLKSGLEMIRLTTNGIKLKNNPEFIKLLVDKEVGIQGLNISFHNEDFLSFEELRDIYLWVKRFNPNIKVRINSNMWKGNLDNLRDILSHIDRLQYCMDEMRISNIIPKDSFSVNPKNNSEDLVLSDEQYNELFDSVLKYFSLTRTCFENKDTLGFVRYQLIPTYRPIILNRNIGSTVSEQVCENDLAKRKINTFKCLVNGEISLSWNTNNVIKL